MWLWAALAGAAEPSIDGTWVLAESAEALASKHEAALTSAMAQLPWAIRPLAKGRLAKPISNCQVVELALNPAVFEARCDARPAFVRSRAATDPITGEDGKPYTVQLQADAASVQLSFLGEDGGQRTRYVRDGDRLLLTKEIVSSWFTDPVRWTVAYKLR